MTTRSARRHPKRWTLRRSSSSWRSRTSGERRTGSRRSISGRPGSTAGCRWGSRRGSRRTPPRAGAPGLAYDAARSVRAAADLHARAGRENLFIKIPGTAQGLPAIEEATFAGVPVNVTLLFSHEQYLASADAYMRGIERRIEAGLDPSVASVASVF